MFDSLLNIFPANVHPLILVSDPDGLLTDESVLSALSERGFTIIQERDPVLLRYRVEQVKPFDSTHPVLIITFGALEALPYDLWQQGEHITLALHTFFPNLSYPILRTLTSLQRARLNTVKLPREPFSERRTVEFLLANVFGFQSNLLQQPAHFILWLDEYHQTLAPLPAPLLNHLLEQVRAIPAYQAWPLKEILQDAQAYKNFVQDQWHGFLSLQTGKAVGETKGEYLLRFDQEHELQDALPRLVRNGSLKPVQLETQAPLPTWVVPGVLVSDEDPRPRRMAELTESLNALLADCSPDTRWETWQTIARQWAELSLLTHASRGTSIGSAEPEANPIPSLIAHLDTSFTEWLTRRYSTLATQKLPSPHHVHHIPHYLNYLRSQGKAQKIALLVMDGMSLADWLLVKDAWQPRHVEWQFKENLVLAQIPTITAISRHALISGLRPADFYIPNATKLTEVKAWNAFWAREGLPENAIDFLALNFEKSDPTPEITNPRLQALCLIERQLDEIMHGSTLGNAGLQNSIALWLSGNQSRNSEKLEIVIQTLLEQNFTVFISSDHGHCEAVGMGKPAEGLMAESRGQRARLYTDHRSAQHVQSMFGNTILWEKDGLLPQDLIALLPSNRQAFAEHGDIIVTHGGITMDELVVPLVEINRK
jgi:hypothetical protein